MRLHEYIQELSFCPFCGQRLLPNPYYNRTGAVYCEEHGDFFVEHGKEGLETCLIFRPYVMRKRGKNTYRRDNPYASIKCDQTGIIYKNLSAIVKDMGLNMSSLSRHVKNHPHQKHVQGFTFSVLRQPRTKNTD
jgi:hypothetical protein